MSLPVTVVHDDVVSVEADVLLLKYARSFHRADEAVALRLTTAGVCGELKISPGEGEYCLVPTQIRDMFGAGIPAEQSHA